MATVLIVEDTELQAALVQRFLRAEHTVVGRAQTATGAAAAAEKSNPDAVVMDLNLEDSDGIEATKKIKAYDEDIPVIISTVNVNEEVKQRALDAGGDEYLTKPYSQDDLLNALDRVC